MLKAMTMIVLLAACFFAAVLNLAADNDLRRRITGMAAAGAVCVGAVLYGYGYAWVMGLSPVSLVRALLALCRMFGGVNDLGSVQAAPLFSSQSVLTVFWFGHFLAFYVTASAAIATLGERLLRRIRVTRLRRGPLLLIYGLNANAVAYGRRMAREKRRSVLFVDAESVPALEGAVKSLGAILDRSDGALSPDARFLRQIGMRPGSRRLELAALHTDGHKNLQYAQTLLDALTEAGIAPEQASLLIAGIGAEAAALQAIDGPGYGSVYAFDDHELTARMIVREHPPCGLIPFDDAGRAAADFHAVILGFGRMGRAVLAQLVMNGQFTGSRFRADVFDPGPQNGFLHEHALLRHYDIRFHPVDGKSDEFYAFLADHRQSVRCVILCTGSREENREIADDLALWYRSGGGMPLLLQANRDSYCCMDADFRETQRNGMYGSDALDVERMDGMAMQINHRYRAGVSAQEDWRRCDYFSRMSCRASADFFPAVLRAAGKTADQVLDGDWPPPAETLENMAITEHLRWCAFHYVMGYAPMPEEEYARRAERYSAERSQGGKPGFALGKDPERRLHACLIPWEELDALSARENAVTGGTVDYKQMDRDNVLALRDVLLAQRSAEDERNG